MGEMKNLRGDSLKNIVDKRIHDRHGLSGNSRVWMDLNDKSLNYFYCYCLTEYCTVEIYLLEHTVYVHRVAFLS